MTSRATAWLPLTLTLLACPALGQAGSGPLGIQALASDLVHARTEIDRLEAEISEVRARARARLVATEEHAARLELDVEAARLEVERLRAMVATREQALAKGKEARARVVPVLRQAIGELRGIVSRGLPFMVEARLAQVDRLARELSSTGGELERVILEFWSMVDDEARMCREVALFDHVVEMGGERFLARVARVGMVAMYVLGPEGRVGVAQPAGDGGWTFRPAAAGPERDGILELFRSLERGKGRGRFNLPFPGVGEP